MNRRELNQRIRDFDDGGTPEWRMRNQRGVGAWYRRSSPLRIYVVSTLALAAAIALLVIGSFAALMVYDALTRGPPI